MEIIDAHHHLWDLKAVHYPWLAARGERRFFGDPTAIQRDYRLPDFLADHGPAAVASVHVQVGAADPLAETAWVAGHAAAHGWPMAIVAHADLASPDLADQLDRLDLAAGGRLRGIRQIVARHPSEDGPNPGALLEDRGFRRGLALLADRSLRFDLQLTAPLLARAAALLAGLPRLRVALCHCGSPWDASPEAMAGWRDGLAAMAALPNVAAKLSGLGMLRPDGAIRPLVDGMLAAFPPDRLMWGSNVPVDALHRPWGALLAEARALVPAQAQAAIFGGTARCFYGFNRL